MIITELPPEIVHSIYHQLAQLESDSQRITAQPVCRTLLPFTQGYLYRAPRLTRVLQAQKFVDAILGSNACGELVKKLHFDFDVEWELSEDEFGEVLARTDFVGAERIWVKLTKLEAVTFHRATSALDSLIAASATGTTVASLEAITAEDSFRGWIDAAERAKWAPILRGCPGLASLTIDTHPNDLIREPTLGAIASLRPSGGATLSHALKSIAFDGGGSEKLQLIANFCRALTSLENLRVGVIMDPISLGLFLHELNLPELGTLELTGRMRWHHTWATLRTLDLAQFAKLKNLRLFQSDVDLGLNLVLPRSLQRLQVPGRVPFELLTDLFGPALPNLRSVELEAVMIGRIGRCRHAPGDCPVSLYKGSISRGPRWVATSPYAEDQVRTLVNAAERHGVSFNQAFRDKLTVADLLQAETDWVQSNDPDGMVPSVIIDDRRRPMPPFPHRGPGATGPPPVIVPLPANVPATFHIQFTHNFGPVALPALAPGGPIPPTQAPPAPVTAPTPTTTQTQLGVTQPVVNGNAGQA